MGEASIYSIEAHEVLARAARICTILDNSAISPLHLLLSIYYSESYTFLSDYLSEGQIPEDWQQRLSEIKQRLSQAAESAPAPSEALEQAEAPASTPAALEEQAANPLEELRPRPPHRHQQDQHHLPTQGTEHRRSRQAPPRGPRAPRTRGPGPTQPPTRSQLRGRGGAYQGRPSRRRRHAREPCGAAPPP